ncbi:MAG: hypothetical protein ACRDQ5_27635 [Sciscionella sp.]
MITTTHRAIGLVSSSVALLAAVVACGQSSTAARAPGTSGTTTASAPVSNAPRPNAPNPNAPETNPPGDIPDNQVFVPYTPAGGGFTISVPEGWARRTNGAATVFSDKYNSARIERTTAAKPPTVASARSRELPTVRASVAGYQPGAVREVRRTSGPVLLITYAADSPRDPVTGRSVTEAVERYEFWRGGKEVVVTLAAPKGSDNVDPWHTITNSFQWK